MSQLHPLAENQLLAVDPRDTVWLSASAGTGKTQVLSSRVLRLLLRDDVSPSNILCLTFTKAGATEMANRVNEVLARWVRMPDPALGNELLAIGAPNGPPQRAKARTLFAQVLDCPGGGLRIDTIHAFSQWLLSAFPQEAGLTPGTRALEDREKALLLRQVLAELLVEAEAAGDGETIRRLDALSLRMGGDGVERFLLRCSGGRAAWFGPLGWASGDLAPRIKALLELGVDETPADVAPLCADDTFPVSALRLCLESNRDWGTPTGLKFADAVEPWLAMDAPERLAALGAVWGKFFTQKDEATKDANLVKRDPGYPDNADIVREALWLIRDRLNRHALAAYLADALTLGRQFAQAWDAAKLREGVIDFDDQIRAAADLLGRSEISAWIRYKLDRQIDHVLVDEAQDTNAAQWDIIDALCDDFYSGEGQRADKVRTLFVVGDYKQAIFGFQGTSPENFKRAKQRVQALLDGLRDSALGLREPREVRGFQDLGLERSFRTPQCVLDVVDRTMAVIGRENIGLSEPLERHEGQHRPGIVTLWQPVAANGSDDEADADDEGEGGGGAGAEGAITKPERELADRLASQIAEWLDPRGPGFTLVKDRKPRRARPGDIMILVRSRRTLAGLIVARLYARGVPVAGVDRLRLGAPLAVRDLVAALRFAAQPLDDLNLASLLVSPLIGWSQEDLLAHGYRGERVRLWPHLGVATDPLVLATREKLLALLRMADFGTPQALLGWLLVGPWQGRARLVARLGAEANDPINELVNAAHAFSTTEVPSLVGFLNWFDANDGDLKREGEGKADLVRVMTVHGSKGLQAPIVILADAAADLKPKPGEAIDLPAAGGVHLPLPPLAKDERLGPIAPLAAAAERAEREEHWRLLYVAMTRTEEALFITGALGKKKTEVPEESWYNKVLSAMPDEDWRADPLWGAALVDGLAADTVPAWPEVEHSDTAAAAPDWLARPVGEEPRPPRPLAPSSLGEDHHADPPLPPGAGVEAARRGTLIHRLLERLPEVADPAAREAAALAWLGRAGFDLDPPQRADIASRAVGVVNHPDWADLFGPQALAEAPFAALVGERVVAGTIDRLLISEDRVRLVDFKSARRPPDSLADVPVGILRQMGAYAAALEVLFPGRRIEAALLYTQTPHLIAIPQDVLAAHKPHLSTPE